MRCAWFGGMVADGGNSMAEKVVQLGCLITQIHNPKHEEDPLFPAQSLLNTNVVHVRVEYLWMSRVSHNGFLAIFSYLNQT